MLVNKKVLLN